MSAAFTAYLAVIMNCRCFFLSLCYTSVGKALEAAALFDMLHSRIDDPNLGQALMDPLKRLFPLFDRVQKKMPSLVGRWRCRGLAKLALGAAKDSDTAVVSDRRLPADKALAELVGFPPKVRDIPCKPLLFDLAFQCIEEPNFQELLPKDTKKKGVLGAVAGRIGGLFGRGR